MMRLLLGLHRLIGVPLIKLYVWLWPGRQIVSPFFVAFCIVATYAFCEVGVFLLWLLNTLGAWLH